MKLEKDAFGQEVWAYFKRGRMAGQLKLRIRFEKCIGDWFDYLLVSKKEMQEILKDTGWKIKKFIRSGKSFYIAIIEKERNLLILSTGRNYDKSSHI